jgi:L,D-transpeptidase YcbB
MIFQKRKQQFQGLARALAIGVALIAGGHSQAIAENGVTIDQIHIEPAFGTPTQTNNGPAVSQTEVVAEQAQIPMLTPNSSNLLQSAEQRYAAIASRGGFPKVPRGTFKKGSKGDGVGILNQRLFMEGYLRPEGAQGDFAKIFTSATEDSVKRYQRNLGLAVTGKVDANTLFQLNVDVSERLAAIRANIPRLEVYEQDLGDRYLVVNVPAQQAETVNGGHVFSRHNVIVGKPERPSPVVMTPLAEVKFNPYWNAPVSIVERDIIPKLQSGTRILTDMDIKVFAGVGGPEIDPSTIDWSSAIPDDYAFRQEPGPANAMATAKIEFPSPFGIYLHDTPERQLFKTNNRFYSSGCVRVDKMPLLVRWVLDGQDGFGEAKISTMAETLERLDVPLIDPPQLRVAYLTAWPATKNTVAFRHDVYELDGTGFTVGQPMPVGETSPDGLRYVLKPLPRQTPLEAAEAEGFGLFNLGKPKSKLFGAVPAPKKNLFGKTLLSKNINANQDIASNTNDSPVTAKPVKGKKFSGLFDWEAYRKRNAEGATTTKSKKKKKLATSKKDKSKIVTISVDNIPPEPVLDVPVKKPATKTTVKPASCSASASGKMPAGCKAAVTAIVKPKP